jgi:glycosyltransferase involved in cell wall biosynthesis
MKVALCVCTYRRPAGLRRLLAAIAALRTDRVGSLEVVVIDNDPDGSARAVVDAVDGMPFIVRYAHEARRGISHARNRAVAEAADADWIAFLDDDEEPEPEWLNELLRVQAVHAADVVAGPVPPRYEVPAPRWVLRGRFHEPPRRPTGSPLPYADTGNVLVRASLFRDFPAPFAPSLALAGGEDTHFFLRVARAGHRIVWADAAVAWEWVPPSRVRLPWLLRRAFRRGNTWALLERELDPSWRVRALRIARGAGRIVRGAVLLPLSLLRGRHAVVETLRGMCFGAGSLAGVAGYRYDEYRTTHGA